MPDFQYRDVFFKIPKEQRRTAMKAMLSQLLAGMTKEEIIKEIEEYREKVLKAILDYEKQLNPIEQYDTTFAIGELYEIIRGIPYLNRAKEKQMEWTSVKDKLPEEKKNKVTHDFEYVLCATTFGAVRAYKFGKPIGWNEPHFWHGAGNMDEYVTHWMPFPDMPDLTNT